MTSLKDILKSVEFVVDANGKKKAAQLSISAWEALLDWIENREDEQIFKTAMAQLQKCGSPEKAGWLDWEAVKDEWDED
ncbi:hypothetical protein QUA81_01690 [Microcoleus sp. F6_B4]|uniref:hypothetical protein n=1 Tax=unclassified Microcoleus TaxID=2642155 RepID=UPI002FD5117F